MRKLLLVPNSMQVSPSVVAVIRTKSPRKPERYIVVIVRKIRVAVEIFV